MSQPVADHPSQPVVPVTPRPLPPAIRPTPSPAAKSGLDWKAILEGLRRRWLLALCLGVIAAGAVGACVWFFLPPLKPEVEALLMVRPPDRLLPTSGRPESGPSQQTQLALARSRKVLNAALRQEEKLPPGEKREPRQVSALGAVAVEPDPLAWLEKEIKVTFITPEMMSIQMTGDNPGELKVIVDAVADAYQREVTDMERLDRSHLLEDLQPVEDKFKNELKAHRASVRALKEDLAGGDPVIVAYQQQLIQAELGMLTTEQKNVREQLLRLELEMKLRGGDAVPAVHDAELAAAEAADEDMRTWRWKVQVNQLRLLDYERKKADNLDLASLPIVQNLRDETAHIKKLIAERRKELLDKLKKQGATRLSLKEQKKQLQQMEAYLNEAIQEQAKKVKLKANKVIDLEQFTRVIEEKERALTQVSRRVTALQWELDRQLQPITKFQDAVVREPDNEARKLKMTGLGAAGAFGAVVFLVGFWEFRHRRVSSPAHLVQGVGLDLVGTVPNYSRKLADKYTPSGWQRQLMESVDSARTLLLYRARKENLKVVMVASAVGGEGKTSLACHLATSLARAGRATLLLDADLRKPTAHAVFQMDLEPGLCDLLRGTKTIEQAVRPTNIPNLSFLGAGQCDEHALASLAADGLGAIMQHLRERYDFVIIDTSPVLPVADAMIIGEQVDGVLFSVLQNVSRLPKVQAACQRLAAVGIRLLGAVVSGTDDRGHGYGGYGYDYYYYGSGGRRKASGSHPDAGSEKEEGGRRKEEE
jgi:succinoglycan biosynthesis transport protein ExoP